MKKAKLTAILFVTFTIFFAFAGCGSKDESNVKDNKQTTDMKHEDGNDKNTKVTTEGDGNYFCSMHPLQQSNDAETRCSICKMKLTSKDEHGKDMMKKHEEMEGKHAGMPNMLHFEVQMNKLKSDECERKIKKALKNTEGVTDFFIDILDSRIHLYIDKNKTSKKDIEKAISDLGFDANETKANPEAATNLPDDCK